VNTIDEMKRKGLVYVRSKDIPRARSLLESSQIVASAALSIHVNNKTATMVFKELYDSVRQLGDALWWALGYESESHEASLKILSHPGVGLKEHKLERFRRIRNESNYRGYLISPQQAEEIVSFWKNKNKEIISFIEKKIK